MTNLMVGLLGAALVTHQPATAGNPTNNPTRVPTDGANLSDPVEKEFQKLLEDDDASQAEVDQWIRENDAFAAKGAGVPREQLNRRILARFEPVRKEYEDFLQRHPDHSRARLAFASFLEDIHDEDGSFAQMEKARELDPKNPAVWNNLANYYSHNGPVTNAFDDYARAIELNPNEALYYQNYGTTLYLFRQDATEHFHLTEQQVFDKALDLYAKAVKLAPDDFPLATDVAQTYYGIRPLRTNAALAAWTNALRIAHDESEREGVYLHLARVKVMAGRFDEARIHLAAVTNESYAVVKSRIARALAAKEAAATGTNTTATPTDSTAPAPPNPPAAPR